MLYMPGQKRQSNRVHIATKKGAMPDCPCRGRRGTQSIGNSSVSICGPVEFRPIQAAGAPCSYGRRPFPASRAARSPRFRGQVRAASCRSRPLRKRADAAVHAHSSRGGSLGVKKRSVGVLPRLRDNGQLIKAPITDWRKPDGLREGRVPSGREGTVPQVPHPGKNIFLARIQPTFLRASSTTKSFPSPIASS